MTQATTTGRRALLSGRFLASLFADSGRRASELTVARRAMACEFSVTFPADSGNAVDAGCAALDEVERLERKLSVYIEDSALSVLNRLAPSDRVRVDPELYNLLRRAAHLSGETGGSFDAAAGALVRAWGFYKGPKRVPEPHALAAALESTGSRHVVFDDREHAIAYARPGVEFNLGAIGKGYAIDCALECIGETGPALMQGGQSSVRGVGAPPDQSRGWRVDIGNPLDAAHRPVARVYLKNQALGTSGAANQFFMEAGRRYGHVLDPRTGWPAVGVFSATAICASAAGADALSTAFFVSGEAMARRYCREHEGTGAVLVLPGKEHPAALRIVILGAADAEVIL